MSLSSLGLTEFPRLSKGLCGVLFLGYLLQILFPWIVGYTALVPAKTIPFVWNIITAGFIEQSIFGLIVSIFGLLLCGKLLEPLWTSREVLKFVVFVNTFTLFGVYATAVTSYYITGRERFLYTKLSGFHGVLAGFLVGVKQAMPDQEFSLYGISQIRTQWMPSLLLLPSIIISFVTPEAIRFLPFTIFGTYGSWLYLRYFQRIPETSLMGNPEDEFAFETFFPLFIRPVVHVFASIFHNVLCGSNHQRRDGHHSETPSVAV
ncbi:PREDICTED: rhomboid-like protein 19 [Nelumbo nucifera]|uniref:Rhomboid-like protein 19 n=1 Tax=Nelumbo nucifera TaxID=4432 RepID=A0A1U7ZVZ3_NELNU|nr:PREDICTED: rhomboid-like protein 19 [Nelumbo nucifera]XP_019052875.1 PREDICTED: rhomboid-like protein 19 [Nelumbo nucifera]XP_019052876.1 PREDICTED: rhomboid-like protein 19 [Nelumbo nucifera]